jgi:hypothetical protein
VAVATCSSWFLARGFFYLKMEAIRSSETSVHTISTGRHIPEDGILHSHRCEHLESYILSCVYGCVTNNNGVWIGWLDLVTPSFIISSSLSSTDLNSKSHCDWRSVSQSWCRNSSGAHDQIFITIWQLRSCFCGAPSLTWGRVCLLSESLRALVSHLS